MHTSSLDSEQLLRSRLRVMLRASFGIDVRELDRIQAGTASDNFKATSGAGSGWFVKVYRTRAEVPEAIAAIELTEFAGQGGIPVPAVQRTALGKVIARSQGVVASVWHFVDDAETAEGRLDGARWQTVGSAVGQLHRHLAAHPLERPTTRKPIDLFNLDAAAMRYDRLIEDYRQHNVTDGTFAGWAMEALAERRALLPRVEHMLQQLPP